MRFYTWLRPRIGRFCRAVPGWIAWPFRRVVGLVFRVVNRYLGLPGWILLFGTLVLGVFYQIAALYGNGWDSLGELMFDVLIPRDVVAVTITLGCLYGDSSPVAEWWRCDSARDAD